MLRQLTCDEFKNQPEPFRKGLNVILGSSDGSNAIGKTLFLMILDFAFGGDDYAKMAKEIVEYVPHHTINIEFEFDGNPYFFSRSTSRPSKVNRCNADYVVIDDNMTVQQYREWLHHEYNILLTHTGLREMLDRFFRIYGSGNHDEHRPLRSGSESMVTSVESLMKFLDKYEDIQNLKIAEAEFDVKGNKQDDRTAIDIYAEISNNNEKIEGSKTRLRRLSQQNEEADLRALGINPEQAERLAGVSNELKKLNIRRRKLLSQLNAVRNNMPDAVVTRRRDFDALRRFFPDANLDAFQEVEQFHAKIVGFLKNDINDEISRLEPLIEYVNTDISELESVIKESGIAQNLSQSILTQYASVAREIEKLENDNKELERQLKLIERRNEIEILLASLLRKQEESLSEAEAYVNGNMKVINKQVTGGDRPSPILALKSDKGLSFSFDTPNDMSEGTAYKGLVVYDLTMLSITPLPVIIHDSNIVKRIEDMDFERILGIYENSGRKDKQVFIAFDKADSTTQTAHEILETNAVLRLSVNEPLFGRPWNRRLEKA